MGSACRFGTAWAGLRSNSPINFIWPPPGAVVASRPRGSRGPPPCLRTCLRTELTTRGPATRLSVPRSGAERRFYSRGGRHRRAAHWAVLSGLDVTHKETHIEKSKSHKRREKDTNRVRYPTKDSARGAQCAARRSPTQKLTPATQTSLYFFIFFNGQSKVPKAERVYLQARGAGMTTLAWCCRRR